MRVPAHCRKKGCVLTISSHTLAESKVSRELASRDTEINAHMQRGDYDCSQFIHFG